MLCISTFPGPIYAKPRLLAIIFFLFSNVELKCISERGGAGFSHCMILVAGSTAAADRAYFLAILLQRNAAREDHDFPIVGSVDSKELVPGLRMGRKIFGGNIERPRRVGLLLGN